MHDIVAIGMAPVDHVAMVPESFFARHGIAPGGLVHQSLAGLQDLLAECPGYESIAGGAAANTLAVLTALGGTGAFIGKVADDAAGALFRHAFDARVNFTVPSVAAEFGTSQILVCVHPSTERSFVVHGGASRMLCAADINLETVISGKILYIEGFILRDDTTLHAARQGLEMAKAQGIPVALNFNAEHIAAGRRSELADFIHSGVDILIGNRAEFGQFMAIHADRFHPEQARELAPLVAVTCGADGARLFQKGLEIGVSLHPDKAIQDTNGAGDAFAAGLLLALARGKTVQEGAQLGARAAARILTVKGGRPEGDWQDLV